MRELAKGIKSSKFLRDAVTLIGGTGLSMAIQILSSPILTRLYSPAEFGAFALYFSFVTFLTVITTAKFELAIVLPKEDKDAAIILLIAMSVALLLSIAIYLVIFGVSFLPIIKTNYWVSYLPITVFFIGVFQSCYYWLNRQRKYHTLALMRVVQSLSIMAFSIIFAFGFVHHDGLIKGYVIGQAVVSIVIFSLVIKKAWCSCGKLQIPLILQLIVRYKDFPLYSTIVGFVESFAMQIPVFFLSAFFGKTIVGFYSLAVRVTSVPTSVIARAIGDVFRQRASSEYVNKGECSAFFRRVCFLLFILGVGVFFTFFIIAPKLFALVFGTNWEIAGEYARILTLMLFLQFIVNPLSNMFIIAERQKLNLLMQIYLLTVNTLSLSLGYYFFHDVKKTLMLFACTYASKYLLELFLSYQFSLGKMKRRS